MNFPKFTPVPPLQIHTPLKTIDPINNSLQEHKSSNKQNNNRRKDIYFSPTSSSSTLVQVFRNQMRSPLFQSQQERPQLKNPQTIKTLKNKILGDYKEQAALNRNRKNSQNSIAFQSQQFTSFKSESCTLTQHTKTLQTKFTGKSRKTSCNLEGLTQFKKNIQKPQPQLFTRDKPTKIQSNISKWDQNNNFHFSNSENQNSKQESFQQQLQIPKYPNIRKNSDHNHHKYQPPSFLSPNKQHRNSFDNCEIIRKKPSLGIQNFLIVRQLGQGTFGRVILAIQKETKIICALKIQSKREIREANMLEQIVRELKIQLTLNHPNIIKVYGYFDDLLYFYIIMECALDGRLTQHISKSPIAFSQKQTAAIMTQICAAVLALHSEAIIHRDLKTENLMFHEGIVKLCDFGWSVKRDSKLRSTFCGTPIYLSPEVLVGQEYDESVDIWALGVMMYEMLFQSNPFKVTCHENLINIVNDSVYFHQKIAISQNAKNIISICLKKKAKERPSIRELVSHPFLKQTVS